MDKIQREYNEGYHSKVSNLKDTFDELQTIYKTKTEKSDKADVGIQLIRGFNPRVAKYTELLKNTKHEVLGMYRLKWIVSDELNEDAIRLVKNGGVVRSIYQVSPDFKVVKDGKQIPGSRMN